MYKNSCRICLSNDQEMKVDLFASSGLQSFADEVMFCSGIKISEDDQLPQNICSRCIKEVETACNIKRKCIESDEMLRQQLEYDKTVQQIADPLLFKDEEITCDTIKKRRSLRNVRSSPLKTTAIVVSDSIKQNKRPEEHDYQCFICNQKYSKISEKNEHVKAAHSVLNRCQICDSTKISSIALERHLKQHYHKSDRFLCQQCGGSFKYQNALKRHLEITHSKFNKFLCDLCGTRTKFIHNLTRHMITQHLKIKRFRCPYGETCPEKMYTTQNALDFHLVGHHNHKKILKCPKCSQKFENQQLLQSHSENCIGKVKQKRDREYVHTNSESVKAVDDKFQCLKCLQLFATRNKFSVHFHQKHKNNLQCPICKKLITQFANLKRHIATVHQQEKRFKCTFQGCEKFFGQKQSLISHQNTHTGLKPFACEHCIFKASDRSTLAKHRKKLHELK